MTEKTKLGQGMQADSRQATHQQLPAEENPGRDGKTKAWNVLQEPAARAWRHDPAVGGDTHSQETSITTCTELLEVPDEAESLHSPQTVPSPL